MAKKLSFSDYDAAIDEAKKCISSDGVLVYPTDTLYGLGCDALSKKAVEKIYSIKKRDSGKPLSIIVSDYAMLRKYCNVDAKQERIMHSLLPGPYTFILGLKKPMPATPTMQVGVRVPEHVFMRHISKELGIPIVTTSANISGKKDIVSISDMEKSISNSVDLIIDDGKCHYAQGSTVIDLISMKVVRKGAVRAGDKFEWEQ